MGLKLSTGNGARAPIGWLCPSGILLLKGESDLFFSDDLFDLLLLRLRRFFFLFFEDGEEPLEDDLDELDDDDEEEDEEDRRRRFFLVFSWVLQTRRGSVIGSAS
jgi:hypothetical protein